MPTPGFVVFDSFNIFLYSLHNSLKIKCCFSHVRMAVLEAATAFTTTLKIAIMKAQNRLGKHIQGKADSTNVWTRRLSFRCEQNIINEAKM